MRRITHASLFSGIGGPEIAAQRMGWTNIFHCEINPFCRKILDYHFPESKSYEDITKTKFTEWEGRIDVLTAGFPCQPFSIAGQRKGANDDRYIWPQAIRVIREVKPTWVVGENVAGILTMVQPGAEIEMGCETSLFGENNRKRVLHRQEYVVETICRDLEREGYSVQPFVIPACAVGAPHRRDRVFFIANRTDARSEDLRAWENKTVSDRSSSNSNIDRPRKWKNKQESLEKCERTSNNCFNGNNGIITNTSSEQLEKLGISSKDDQKGWEDENGRFEEHTSCYRLSLPAELWKDFPTQSPVCRRDDELSFNVDDLTIPFTKWRQESIKAYGNAIVPAVMYEIFLAIEETYK